ncbi:type 1 glutamine amidotransferase domain-containing protein [Amycolatopsis ultiminotia]|uniref:Type 1 glutamine amidotransferase domain-containing protein n=1 Tax=Amycolatopsis ultiminotia TaxID=543629 RepID=A0ABP6YID7_9PSEU
MSTVLIPVPARDSDPTEVAVSHAVLVGAGHRVLFATPGGEPAECDEIMVSGVGLDPWSRSAKSARTAVLGRLLRADKRARTAYTALQNDASWQEPLPWHDITGSQWDGLLLPGGHRARGMREYLESPVLQRAVVGAFRDDRPVAAICHGVLLAARSIDPRTGRSVLHGRRTTALTWRLESTAWRLSRRTRFWDPDYYRTYLEADAQPPGYLSVQQEVTRSLASPSDFLDAPRADRRASSGIFRDRPGDERPAFVVRDGNYVSARWPGDAHTFARTFAALL